MPKVGRVTLGRVSGLLDPILEMHPVDDHAEIDRLIPDSLDPSAFHSVSAMGFQRSDRACDCTYGLLYLFLEYLLISSSTLRIVVETLRVDMLFLAVYWLQLP